METKTYYIGRHEHLGFADYRAGSIDELKQKINEAHTYKPSMAAENVAYWENVKKSIKIYRLIEILEPIDQSNTDEV